MFHFGVFLDFVCNIRFSSKRVYRLFSVHYFVNVDFCALHLALALLCHTVVPGGVGFSKKTVDWTFRSIAKQLTYGQLSGWETKLGRIFER
jgi:hypothetical protein